MSDSTNGFAKGVLAINRVHFSPGGQCTTTLTVPWVCNLKLFLPESTYPVDGQVIVHQDIQ